MEPKDPELIDILRKSRAVAVVGLSANPSAASHDVARYLQRSGYRIIPVNPTLREPVLGETPVAHLSDLKEPVDIIDVFRRPEFCAGVARETAALPWKPKLFFIQLGIESAEARRIIEAAGIPYVEDRCLKIEHRRLVR